MSLILASRKEHDPCSHHSVGKEQDPCLKQGAGPLPSSLMLIKVAPTDLQWCRAIWLGAGALSWILASRKEQDPGSHHSVGEVAPTHLACCKCLVFDPCLKQGPLPSSLRSMKAAPTQLQWCRGIVLDLCLKEGAGPLLSSLCGPGCSNPLGLVQVPCL